MTETPSDDSGFSRRSLLRKGAMTAGGLAVGGAATSGSAAASSTTRKRGGRAQLDGTARRNVPFTLTLEGSEMRNASCMSAHSAMQTYLTYTINYCDSDSDDGTLYVIPDEAELVPDEVFEIHSSRPCRANDLNMVAIGPSNESCS